MINLEVILSNIEVKPMEPILISSHLRQRVKEFQNSIKIINEQICNKKI